MSRQELTTETQSFAQRHRAKANYDTNEFNPPVDIRKMRAQ
jgi:hypothetical protein